MQNLLKNIVKIIHNKNYKLKYHISQIFKIKLSIIIIYIFIVLFIVRKHEHHPK